MHSNKEIAVKYTHRIWNEKDLSAIEEYLDEKVVIHSTLGDFQGPESMKKVVQTWLVSFPDLVVQNMVVTSEQDIVMVHWDAQGSHQGEFKGIKPSGKSIAYKGATFYRVSESKIVEYWAYLEMQHLIQQISAK